MLIKNKYATAVVAVILLCTAAFWLFSGGGFKSARKKSAKSPANVTVTVIAPSMEKTFLKSIGTAVSNESVDIMSCVSQTVASVHFSDCEYVKKGQLLVQLNTERKTAEKKQAEINLLEQQREFFRMETLRKKKIIPEKDYDVQKTKMLDAQAKLDAINADINQSSITAPFDGVLGIRKVSVGALLTQGSVITTIDDVSKMKVDFTVPEKYILLLKPQLKITAKSLALKGKKFKGDILAVVPRVSAVSRNVSVRAVIENKDHILRPGMMLKISVQLDDREVIKIPEKTLSSIGEKHFVFLLCENNRVKKHYVTVGERGHGFIEIEKGLKPGDKIIAEGNGRLSDEDSVNVVKEETLQLIGGKTAAKLPSSDKRGERR